MNSLCNSIKSFYHVPSSELSNQSCSVVVGTRRGENSSSKGSVAATGPLCRWMNLDLSESTDTKACVCCSFKSTERNYLSGDSCRDSVLYINLDALLLQGGAACSLWRNAHCKILSSGHGQCKNNLSGIQVSGKLAVTKISKLVQPACG